MSGNILTLAGALFCLVGCIGLVRLTDFHARVQSVTKSISMGICLILLNVFAKQGFTDMGVRALLCAVLIWVALPAAMYALVHGLHKSEK
jgi:monovalent cation/proton antiporter MnhG/PhaG subunit